MLIVSQNREIQFMFGNGYYLRYYDSCSDYSHCVTICYDASMPEIMDMGSYDSKERAKQVMRQIQDAYANNERVFVMPED